MRLVLPPRGANAGLKRYKGEGIYRSIGRKNTSLRKVTKEEADAIALASQLFPHFARLAHHINHWSSWTNIAEGHYGSTISLFDVDRR